MPQAKKPATVSGPGAMSQRTDGGPASKQALRYVSGMPNYGDGQELMDMQKSAPMAETANPSSAQPSMGQAGQGQAPQAIPLGAPSQRPNEPVTNGAAAGAGAGPEALILPKPTDMRQQEVATLVARYLPDLQAATNLPGVPDSYRKFVNYLSKQAQ